MMIVLVAGSVTLHAQQHIVPDQFTTIQGALDAAVAGDTVMVRPGTYHEFLTLSEGVVLRSEGEDGGPGSWDRAMRTVIHADGLRDGNGAIPPVVNCADNAVLDGFTVTGMDTVNHHLPGHSHAVQNRGTSATIMNCIVHSNGSTGIGSHDKDGRLANPSIIRNRVYGNYGIGIGFNHTSRGIARDNEVFGNREVGIGIQNGAAPEIRDNRVYENGWNGISAREGAWPALIGNEVFNNGTDPTGEGVPPGAGTGIGLDSTSWIARPGETPGRMIVRDNSVAGNPSGGIMSRNRARFEAKRNVCANNGNFQISVSDLSDAVLSENTVQLEDTTIEAGGIVVARGATAELRENDMLFCTTAGLAVTAGGLVSAIGNTIVGCKGSGVHIDGAASNVTLINTRINSCDGAAIICEEGEAEIRYATLGENVSGVIIAPAAAVTFVNNTVVSPPGAAGRAVAVNGRSGSVCYNNIVVGYSLGFFLEESPTVDYNCTYGNQGYNGPPGTGGSHALQADPRFDQTTQMYDLLSDSPCIDAGHPDPQYNDPDGSRADMGARPYGAATAVIAAPAPSGPRLDVYPTVTGGYLSVELRGAARLPGGTTVAVYSLTGARLRTVVLSAGRTALDLHALPAGMYILRALTAQGPVHAKVLLAR